MDNVGPSPSVAMSRYIRGQDSTPGEGSGETMRLDTIIPPNNLDVVQAVELGKKFQEYLVAALESEQESGEVSRTELDSHADSPVVGRNALILAHTGKTANVTGFTKDLGRCMSVPIVTAAIAYDHEYTGETSIILIHNALHFKSMENNLIPPFAIRMSGAEVNEEAKCLAKEPTINHHSIFWPSEINKHQQEIRIPLQLHGTISYFPSRILSRQEVHNHYHFNLSPNCAEWNPHNESYASQEHSMLDFRGEISARTKHVRELVVNGLNVQDESEVIMKTSKNIQVSAVMCEVSDMLDLGSFARAIRREDYNICSLRSGKRTGVTAQQLAEKWNISPDLAKRTLQSTTQLCIRTSSNPSLARRFPTNDRMLRYNRLDTTMFMDTFFTTSKGGTKIKSSRSNTCAQLFVTDFNYVEIRSMKGRAEVCKAIKSLFKDVGVPNAIVADGAREQIFGESLTLCNSANCELRELEKDTPWANRAELYIGIIKKKVVRALKQSNCPLVLWDYCASDVAQINNATAHDHFQLEGMTPHTKLTGQPKDISELCEFGWYEWVYFRDSASPFPLPKESLGRCLGPAAHAGTAMSQYVMNINGTILPKQTLCRLNPSELASPTEAAKRKEFDETIKSKYGDSMSLPAGKPLEGEKEEDIDPVIDPDDDSAEPMPDVDDIPDYDGYINSEVLLPNGEHMQAAKVVRRVRDELGVLKGNYHQNPILDTRVYEVMFPNGAVQEYAANVIAQNLWQQVDSEGNHHQVMQSIVDHRSDGKAVKKEDAFKESGGKKMRRFTTKG